MSSNNQIDLFEVAARKRIRFESSRGELTCEDLWDKDLPLQSKNSFNLDQIARTVNAKVKDLSEGSFVSTKPSPALALEELKLEVVKRVIAVRLQEQEAKDNARSRAEERARLMALLDDKQRAAEAEKSPEEIKQRLADLAQQDAEAASA